MVQFKGLTPEGLLPETARGDVLVDVDERIAPVDRRVENIESAAVNAKSFGAIGDGVTDDTAALKQWIDDPNVIKSLGSGSYVVSDTLVSSKANLCISGPGRLIAATPEMVVLKLSGADTKVSGLEVDGASVGGIAIQMSGTGQEVSNCKIHDFRSMTSSARGVDSETFGNVVVRNNRFWNIHAEGDTTLANGFGMARAVVLYSKGNREGYAVCEGNRIENITGEEADAIAILAYDGVTPTVQYQSAWATIRDNIIINSGRRYIKIQGCDVWVDQNWCYQTSDFKSNNPSNLIDVIQGSRVKITNNFVDEKTSGCPVSIKGASTSSRAVQVEVRGNTLRDGSNDSPVVYLSNTDYVSVTNNTLWGGTYFVASGTSYNLLVAYNDCRAGIPSNTAFTTSSTVSGKIRFNTLPLNKTVGTGPDNVIFEGNG